MEITHSEVERSYVDLKGRKMTIDGRVTGFGVARGSGGWSWSYVRPARVYFEDNPDTPTPLRDYVMLFRVAIVAVSIALFSIQRSLR